MCLEPTILPNGSEVGCRLCWQCELEKVNDFCGRGIAEMKYAKKTLAVTLTYADTAGANAVTLVYADVQQFLKNLRKKYYVRFMVAGEYGSAKNRAHWHIVLFFQGPSKQAIRKYKNKAWISPKIIYRENKKKPLTKEQKRELDGGALLEEENVAWSHWTHGHVFVQEPDWHGIRYLLKYIVKDQSQRVNQTVIRSSNRPGLGAAYFDDLIDEYVAAGIEPKNWKYSFRDIKDRNGKIRKFTIQGRSRDNFASELCRRWQDRWGAPIRCELIDKHFENVIDEEDKEIWSPHLGIPWHLNPEDERFTKDDFQKYIEPWVDDYEQPEWIQEPVFEIDYYGLPVTIFQRGKYKKAWTELGEWHDVSQEAINVMLHQGKILRKTPYEEIMLERWERLDNRVGSQKQGHAEQPF